MYMYVCVCYIQHALQSFIIPSIRSSALAENALITCMKLIESDRHGRKLRASLMFPILQLYLVSSKSSIPISN